MKLLSYTEIAGRFGETCVTDMSVLDFVKWARTNIGNIAVTYVLDISLHDFMRWQAEGGKAYLKGKVKIEQQRFRNEDEIELEPRV